MNLKQYTADIESATSFARRLGIPSTLISQWQTGARRVPAGRCPDIERETAGAVTCEELRPDVDWGYVRNASTVNPENTPEMKVA